MVVTILVFLAFLIVGYYSSVDMLGLYLFLLVIHGIFVKFAGADFQNAPAVIGILVILMVVSKKNLDYWRSRDIKLKYIILYVAIFLAMIVTGFVGIDYDNSMFYMHLYMKGFVLTLLVYLLVDSRSAIEKIAVYYLLGVIAGAMWV
jgi:membrane-associated HD superfamily phosphohydrolase